MNQLTKWPAQDRILVVRRPRLKTNQIPQKLADQLSDKLLTALRQPDDAVLDRVLKEIFFACLAEHQDYFVTPVQPGCKLVGRILGRWKLQNLQFGFYWREGGVTEETLVPELTEDELRQYWQPLEAALRQRSSNSPLQRVVRDVVTALRWHGHRKLTVPLSVHTPESDRLIAAWRAVWVPGESFFFTLDPLVFGLAPAPEPTPQVSAERRELDEKRARLRAARLAAQPLPGPKGSRAPKPWQAKR
jgi:hypothetical protein